MHTVLGKYGAVCNTVGSRTRGGEGVYREHTLKLLLFICLIFVRKAKTGKKTKHTDFSFGIASWQGKLLRRLVWNLMPTDQSLITSHHAGSSH